MLAGETHQRVHVLANEVWFGSRGRIPCVVPAGLSGPSPGDTDRLRIAAQPYEALLRRERSEIASAVDRIPGELAGEDAVGSRSGPFDAGRIGLAGSNTPVATVGGLG